MKLRWSRLLAALPVFGLVTGMAAVSPVAAALSPLEVSGGRSVGLPRPASSTALVGGSSGSFVFRPSVGGVVPRGGWAGVGRGGWNDFSCRPSAAHPRPVVLVHGTLGNGVDNWLGLAPYLMARGYCVFSFTYGGLLGLPVVGGVGSIDASARQLGVYVDRVLAATGARKVDIVGHSQGGMMSRVYLKFYGGRRKVHTLVGLAPNNHGTDLHGLITLLDSAPGVRRVLHGLVPAVTEQESGSPLLRRLNAGGDTVPGVRYTVIATRYDEMITPHRSEFLHGSDVHNVVLQDLCPLDVSGHGSLGLIDRLAFHETANALDPAHATPTTCAY
ncbi:esterase/lipase family protein [Streptomyces sp. GS7]|uniref:esterase/lipase family protein n=1 Tax=Streptomyces sp. GS7 TaxID=2692234 RepID=UPI001F1896AC|nr:alpha/beta fold hydrolase [Streptomyces sp. GS7]